MFTGIIQEVGKINKITINNDSLIFKIKSQIILNKLKVGSSVALDGVCQTVTKIYKDCFEVQVIPETQNITTLNKSRIFKLVNLESALRATDDISGHLVSGHVDGTGKIVNITNKNNSKIYIIELSDKLSTYAIPKGSIAIDGISLTIAKLQDSRVTVAIIPHTLNNTSLQSKIRGDVVNLEMDMIVKSIHHRINDENQGRIDKNFLRTNGFI